MTLPEFMSWQGYFRARAIAATRPPTPAELPALGAAGPGGVAQALRGR